jgi:hypothetical protein
MSKKKIPTEIDEIYEALYQQVSYLYAKWGVFCQLYGSTKEVVDLLNNSAPSFFRICEDVLVDDILLNISRLTDPKQTFKRDNLSLERLVHSIDEVQFPKLKDEIEKLLAKAKDKCTFARDLRNKRIAHNDLSTKLQVNPNPLPTVTRKKIEDALESICNVMNAVAGYFEDSTVAYELAILPNDGNTLIARLRDAKIYRKQLRELRLSGKSEA